MTALDFSVTAARPARHAAVPTMQFSLRASERSGGRVHAAAVQCQIRIEPQRRSYTSEEETRLFEMFGDTPQWGDSLRPFLWTHASTVIPGFAGKVDVDLPVECTYDFEVAGAKYMHLLAGGEIPLLFLFSGTVFSEGASGFSAQRIGWEQEARFRLPVESWREMIDAYFPGSAWLRVSRGTLDDLYRYRVEHALPTWDQAIEKLIKEGGQR